MPQQPPNPALPAIEADAPLPVLVVEDDEGGRRRIQCPRVVTLLGGRPGCKVRLNHRRVSPVHAALVHDGSRVHVVDLVTRYGTMINDLRIEQEWLRDGDVLTIEPWSFQVELGGTDSASEAAPRISLEPQAEIVGLEHMETKRLLQSRRAVCIIGRRAGCDIALSDLAVSRVHALFFRYRGEPAIADLLSENGITVNDEPVRFRLLEEDDVISIGSTQFRVRTGGLESGRTNGGSVPGANGKILAPSPHIAPARTGPDLIDIKETEGSQSWRIADSLKRAKKPSS
jgi:pSer/pThr/pTyr-binding forkhead associated (FHA) protein